MSGTAAHDLVSHYRIEEKIGGGGMGNVYRATDEKLGRRVALKFLQPGSIPTDEARRRFLAEARAASSLDHPNICGVFDIDTTDDGETFIVMPYYEGETLDLVIGRGQLESARAFGIALQIAHGLAAAHEELIVHRDIKPANIIVTPRETVKILDFGLAKVATSRPSLAGVIIGTPAYMSPEQLRGESIDPRTDIWSFAVVLYEMLAGTPPFAGDNVESLIYSVLNSTPAPLSSFRPDLPRALDGILERALAKDRRLRYEQIGFMISDLGMLQHESDPVAITMRRRAAAKKTSIAVLPFADMSPSHDQAYLCDGIAEEILASLRRVPDLFVASRTAAFQFKDRAADTREIGSKLHVDHLLEGSVRRAEERVRISAQLVEVETGYRLWYERYDRDVRDIFAVEDEIAESIAAALQVTLTGERTRRAMSSAEAESYDAYLQGRQYFHHLRRKALDIAIQSFEQAIAIDPQNARAYAGIADCNSILRLYFGGGPDRVEAAARASAKAVEIDSGLAETHAARGLSLFLTRAVEEAERELRRAIEIDPMLYDPHYIFGRVAFEQGHIEQAAAHFQEACRISPDAHDSWYFLGMCYRRLGETAKARSTQIACIEAAKRRLRVHPDDTRAGTMGAAVLADLGEPDRAEEWLRRALSVDPEEPLIQYNAACVFTALGKYDDALRCLETQDFAGALSKSWLENDPDLDPLRSLPRFQALLLKT